MSIIQPIHYNLLTSEDDMTIPVRKADGQQKTSIIYSYVTILDPSLILIIIRMKVGLKSNEL